jgi:uncharacterized protein YecE (DUF72 family)
MDWYIGTMGFSYKDWAGVFYPEGLASREYLTYYSRIFNAVEIDSSFYGTPRLSTIERWAAGTPDGFKFALKTPRAITHDLVLQGAEGLMAEFLDAVRRLGDKLGVILIQFPPSFHLEQMPVLDDFLGKLPSDLRFAVEVRHRSWYAVPGELAAMLAGYSVCWAATQYPGLPRQIYPTTSFFYIRWIGKHGAFESHTHERIDREQDLAAWWEIIQTHLPGVDAIFGFTNNDYAGFGPGTANRFKNIAGLPVEPLQPPQQGRLF